MNRQSPRVFVVSVTAWWLGWITWRGQWEGRSESVLDRRAGIFDGIPRSEMECFCAEPGPLPLVQLSYPDW